MNPLVWVVLRRLVLLVVIWLGLWGDVSVANVASGLLVAGIIIWLFPPRSTTPRVCFRPVAVLRVLWVFVTALVKGSVMVAREVLRARQQVNDGIVAVRMRTEAPFPTAVVSALISLVPGTLTVATEGSPKAFYIHVFDLTDPEAVVAEVHHYEDLVDAAFGHMVEDESSRELGGDWVTCRSGPHWEYGKEDDV